MGKENIHMDIKLDISNVKIDSAQIDQCAEKAKQILKELRSGDMAFTGWVNLPETFPREDMDRILEAAEKIRAQCKLFIVIGIGGSYVGAKAAIEALAPDTSNKQKGPVIAFAGINFSAAYHKSLLDRLQEEDTCICVISKSGSTAETDIAYHIFKEAMFDKYGQQAKKRIYVITSQNTGMLREEAKQEGYETFPIPEDIGGRYSVLSEVGLLPMAVAGIDVKAMHQGAAAVGSDPAWESWALEYGICRYLLNQQGKVLETFLYYEPSLGSFVEWAKQLFAESEGKEGQGIFPAGLNMTGDLHSLGQFLQQGNQIFFETVLNIAQPPLDIEIPAGSHKGKTLNTFNQAAQKGVIEAHKGADIPIITVTVPQMTPYAYGQMVYFFEISCAITARLMGVNPFDQPGVERYKAEMKKFVK